MADLPNFEEKFLAAYQKRHSLLCVGLDPALQNQRQRDSIPKQLAEESQNEARLTFCLDIIEKTASVAMAAKPNEQYLFGFTADQHRTLTKFAHDNGLLCILDCKLGDIGDTAQSKTYWVRSVGYDAITVHTQQGNLQQMVHDAHSAEPQVGIFPLVIMSNSEAVKYFKNSTFEGEPVYVAISRDVEAFGADGLVVGATGHVTEDEIRTIVRIVDEHKVFLVPGIGTQRGDPEKMFRAGARKLIFNVGRDIIYSQDPSRKAHEYFELFDQLRRRYSASG